ncbi:hypothetical protein ACF1AO_33835 [Streptomyces longwoodensis]|uniref:hypothetical protein n=1 Tax=Streptomyces longwoodensis TaxID=68231 RepID=UPI003702E0C1
MPEEEFTFTANTGSHGYRVLDRQELSTCYGFAWYHADCRAWVAEFPGSLPGSGGGVPGFASREWAARFLYRYRRPEPSGRP